jgi:hypothetical protein
LLRVNENESPCLSLFPTIQFLVAPIVTFDEQVSFHFASIICTLWQLSRVEDQGILYPTRKLSQPSLLLPHDSFDLTRMVWTHSSLHDFAKAFTDSLLSAVAEKNSGHRSCGSLTKAETLARLPRKPPTSVFRSNTSTNAGSFVLETAVVLVHIFSDSLQRGQLGSRCLLSAKV